ncbi:MAG TPA: aminotransferase class I/II-fold pyridoxal phosphate-dependent enzyme [Thermoanaerobaculia bacterium]|nr:aminotransferase class I/II-fold pyridoxal phosphate-dependent enzyme [Thermoanaerobaculia bacterium]
MKFETRVVHAGHEVDPHTGSVAPPLYLSTTFARDPEGTPLGGHTYIRESNPNQDQLEAALAPLEGGEAALVFASGMAAGTALLQTLPPGSHVVFPDDAYYGYRAAAGEILPNWGIHSSFVAMEDLAALAAAVRPETRLVVLESPSNPLLKVVDLAAAAEIARRAGALTMVDNTFATPALQNPLALGADVVLHSTTKYLGGHSDVQGGALIFARRGELYEKVHHQRHIVGSVASPFNSWLVLRGIRTLACRVKTQSATALAVAQALEKLPAVAGVHYPGLASHPGHEIASRQMSGFGAMLSIRAAGGREPALRAVSRVRLFTRATSLGGIESLIEHRATSEGPGSRTPQDLLRISIGLEHADDLIEDLEQALGGGD